jgi:molybdopterin/thiamine biosynthesis adenylyltransferase
MRVELWAAQEDIIMKKLDEFLKANAQGDLLPWKAHRKAMKEFSVTCRHVEDAALTLNLLPARYQRNRKTISTTLQRKLFQSKAAVIGCGGLGGYIVEELARLGVGTIKAIDPDVFEEHNLNRQILCKVSDLGKPKAKVAQARVRAVNPATKIIPYVKPFSRENGEELLAGMDVVVDALDSVPTRLELAECCAKLHIPMVHGTIGGWYGQVTTQLPGDDTVQMIYRNCKDAKGVERMLGNPSFTPAVVASLEVAEVCKLLLDQGSILRKRMLFINLLDMEIDQIEIGETATC